MSVSRRGFLRGHFRSEGNTMRPPWAVTPDFESLCTRCGDCLAACPTRVIQTGGGGFPVIDFEHGECTFCHACVAACKPAALFRDPDSPATAWPWRVVVAQACLAAAGVECRVCGEACGVGAIRFRPRMGGVPLPQLDADACTGCGACFGPCPVRAISMESRQ
ncbi:MAG: ferredoxin-type protein NapF [Rhodocyclaceae bacterium]